jgi:hypothetical protein
MLTVSLDDLFQVDSGREPRGYCVSTRPVQILKRDLFVTERSTDFSFKARPG